MNELSRKNPYYNDSGCADPTAYAALQPIVKEDRELERKAHNLINILKFIIDWAGFDLTARIKLKDKDSGREFK